MSFSVLANLWDGWLLVQNSIIICLEYETAKENADSCGGDLIAEDLYGN